MARLAPSTWHDTLTALWRRNGCVELSPLEWPGDGPSPRFRTRLLELGSDTLTVERPGNPAVARVVGRGAPLRVLAVDGEDRWEFLTAVIGGTAVQLNPATRVQAVKLEMPALAASAQRRHHFRAETAGITLEPALVIALPDNPVIEVKSIADRPTFPAMLVNISGGGLGLETPQRATPLLFKFSRFRVWIDLPTGREPLEAVAKLVHTEPLKGGSCYAGLRFEFTDDQEAKKVADAVSRFTAWQQRRVLSRLSERA